MTRELIQLAKQNGFNSIRLPCAWDQYIINEETYEIDEDWLERVKDVVKYCIDEDLYVLLNVHWDGGWLENNCTIDKQEINNEKQQAIWSQIATYLRDFNEKLLFASANEPNVDNEEEMAVLNSYHQTFIDTVRQTGGRNAYRVLIIQGPSTDIEKTLNLMNVIPTDKTPDRLMVEIHYYTPWNFCGMEKDEDWGDMFYYWGSGNHSSTDTIHNPTWGEESTIDQLFKSMKTKFVDEGIPVIIGEFGAIRRTRLSGESLELHLKSRDDYHRNIVNKATELGLIPFYWDNGGTGDNSTGIFYRNKTQISDQRTINALLSGLAH
ncbi:glycoside hydrolase family 5 protein [Thiospirochaeta perfilievii]|uniref:glycoside hydrolase family 5 protein n=1 Tax=Thiospirochaeta perfilievii TaxID=252967 RepID=UPI001CA8ECF3|nr:glycoside hydrolase family 5 protein [Thiospirochaeta perfilievii]